MKTFFESGIMKEVPYFINGSGTFYIQELKDADFDKYKSIFHLRHALQNWI